MPPLNESNQEPGSEKGHFSAVSRLNIRIGAVSPMPLLQNYIGHSDVQTLHRYLARISAKSDLAKQLADNMAKIQGTVPANVMAEAVKV